jgi:hypothetical protein
MNNKDIVNSVNTIINSFILSSILVNNIGMICDSMNSVGKYNSIQILKC